MQPPVFIDQEGRTRTLKLTAQEVDFRQRPGYLKAKKLFELGWRLEVADADDGGSDFYWERLGAEDETTGGGSEDEAMEALDLVQFPDPDVLEALAKEIKGEEPEEWEQDLALEELGKEYAFASDTLHFLQMLTTPDSYGGHYRLSQWWSEFFQRSLTEFDAPWDFIVEVHGSELWAQVVRPWLQRNLLLFDARNPHLRFVLVKYRGEKEVARKNVRV